jgi:hypothetical protein
LKRRIESWDGKQDEMEKLQRLMEQLADRKQTLLAAFGASAMSDTLSTFSTGMF